MDLISKISPPPSSLVCKNNLQKIPPGKEAHWAPFRDCRSPLVEKNDRQKETDSGLWFSSFKALNHSVGQTMVLLVRVVYKCNVLQMAP